MATPGDEKTGLEAINKLKSTDPPQFLSPNSDLSLSSRTASQYLYAAIKPYSTKSLFDQLLTDGFDAEQIWQQIDLQSNPLISTLKREIKRFEKNPGQILKGFGKDEGNKGLERTFKGNGNVGLVEDGEEFDGLSDDMDEDDDEGEERENGVESGEDEDEEEGEEDEEDDDGDDDEEEFDDADGVPEVEDGFLKVKELEKFLVKEEKREYGSEENLSKKKKKKKRVNEDEDEDEDEEDGEDDDELLYAGGDDDEDGAENIRYGDFFVPDKKKEKRKRKQVDKSDDSEMEDEDEDEEEEEEDEEEDEKQLIEGKQLGLLSTSQKENLSTHEKELLKKQAEIEEMEKANLDPKEWTMQGEVTATKRPKDSALEVDLDFEHNVRPPPVITEEVTESLEEIIKKRILEGNFDDVQRAPKLLSAAPKERKELDDNKSKKGLADVYEEEFAQQTGLGSAPVSHNDELKKEASKLIKELFSKLDALSHFHFAPKPVVEDMSIQANLPALAMEEVAPVAVSDAAMLAPEEVFSGKGDIKEETELTKEDRKRRRAKKKRKNKAINATIIVKRPTEKPSQTAIEGK